VGEKETGVLYSFIAQTTEFQHLFERGSNPSFVKIKNKASMQKSNHEIVHDEEVEDTKINIASSQKMILHHAIVNNCKNPDTTDVSHWQGIIKTNIVEMKQSRIVRMLLGEDDTTEDTRDA
jgi:hypothetical protein